MSRVSGEPAESRDAASDVVIADITTMKHTAMIATRPKRSWAMVPFTRVRAASVSSAANCRLASTAALPAVVAATIAYQPRGQRGVSEPTKSSTSAPAKSAM
ncbi:MAG: hypothetical protein EBY88_06645 [Actinobacteria bacterium]|nr:hypothetical protein [Actinomycetota bacterium]